MGEKGEELRRGRRRGSTEGETCRRAGGAEGRVGGAEITVRLTFRLFGDPSVDVLPGLLWSCGEGQLLQLGVVELQAGLLKRLWREMCGVRPQRCRKCQPAARHSGYYIVLRKSTGVSPKTSH